jgi:hypothetical protein
MDNLSKWIGALSVALVFCACCAAARAEYPYRQDRDARDAFLSRGSLTCLVYQSQVAANSGVPQSALARYCDCTTRLLADVFDDQDMHLAGRSPSERTRTKGNAVGTVCALESD